MTLLLPDPRPWVFLEQPVCKGLVSNRRLGGKELNLAQMLGADVAVLVRADETDRRTVVAVEWPIVEVLRDQYVIVECILDHHDRGVVVEALEDEAGDDDVSGEGRLDDLAVERREGDPFPTKVEGRPPSDAVEVGGELATGSWWEVRSARS